MEISVISIDACTQEVSFTLSQEDFIPHFERAYQKAQPTIEIKGFRKGKVPLSIIKQRFGKQIEQDSMMDVADAEFRNYTRNNNVKVIGQPELRDLKPSDDGSMTYVIRFSIIPEFELASYEGLEIKKPIAKVTDEDVQKIIDEILLKNATSIPAELVEDAKHNVTIRFTKVDDETGEPLEGLEPQENTIFLDHPDLDGFLRDALIGKKVGDTVTYMDATQGEENPDRFEVTILSAEKIVPATLDEEFVKKYSNGSLSTVEEMENSVRDYNNRMLEDEARKEMEIQIVDIITAKHDFQVPHSLVHDVMHGMFDNFKKQQGPSAAELKMSDFEEMFRPYAEQTARWELIRDRIIEKEGITLEEQDILPYLQYYRSQTQMNDNQILSYLMKDNAFLGSILARKVMEKVISLATILDVDPQAYFAEKDMEAMVQQMQDTAEAASSSKAKPAKTASKTAKPKAEGKAKEAKTSTKAKKSEEAEAKPKKKSTKSSSAGE
ncbi:MAG: trigger factor [Ignavibacteria bacterium]